MCSKCEWCSLAFFFCRVGCFRCCQKIQGKEPEVSRPTHSVIMLGLSQAGKSVLLAKIGSESTDDINPTKGFSVKAVQLPNAILNVKELGGGDDVRGYWKHYYDGSEGVIFVVDSTSNEDDLDLAASELQETLSHPSLASLPVLVLANKQNEKGARPVEKVEEILNLGTATHNREFLIKPCSLDDMDNLRQVLSLFVKKIAGLAVEQQPDNRI